ncbi:MAG: HD domain-containing protein [Candidatus Berkelbacteria bacterium]
MDYDKLLEVSVDYYQNNVPSSREKLSYFAHVDGVRKYALILADEYSADKQVVEISALLHDIGADLGKIHAAKSAEMAESFLVELEVEALLRDKIISAIRNHSMSQDGEEFAENVPIEEAIIRDADAISFFENGYQMYLQKGLKMHGTVEKAKEESILKIQGMMNKITTKRGVEIASELRERSIEYINNFEL